MMILSSLLPEEKRKFGSDVNVLFCVDALRIRASGIGVGSLNAGAACLVKSGMT